MQQYRLTDNIFRLSPLFASQDLIENAPETFIFTSEFDIFNNDAFMMAKRMTDSGVTVHVETNQNAMHNEHYLSTQFWGFSTMIPSGRFSKYSLQEIKLIHASGRISNAYRAST